VRELPGDGTWPIDDEGRPVVPALLWLDSRAARLVGEIRGKYPPAEPGALDIGPLEAAVRIADAILHLLAT
jgi:sugar (pentulose or hexulose) kinase